MAKLKYAKNGRPSKGLKQFADKVFKNLQEWGDDSTYSYENEDQLLEIEDISRRKYINKPEPIENLEQTNQQENNMSENTVNSSEDSYDFSDDFSGLNEEVIERTYNKVPVNQFTGQDVPEPEITSSIDAMLKAQTKQRDEQEASQGQQQEKQDYSIPEISELDDKEKTMASEQLVDAILEGYEGLHSVAKHYTKFNESQLTSMVTSGEIDGDVLFPVDASGNEVNIMQYAELYNENVDQIFQYDPEFNKKVRPPMVRYFKKQNWGVKDEWYILGMFAKDAGIKATQAIQLKQSTKMIINALKDHTKEMNKDKGESISPNEITRPIKVEDVEQED